METSRELSDMDVSITEGELAKTGSVHTYEDAGPSTKKRHTTEFHEVTEEGTDLDRATHTLIPSSPVRRKGKGKSVSLPAPTKTHTSPHKPKLYQEDIEENEDQFIIGTSYYVDEELQEELSGNQKLNFEFASLKAIPKAWDFFEEILSEEDQSEAISIGSHFKMHDTN
ncbi:unnamed protein product [Umbelopsis ramanniana]